MTQYLLRFTRAALATTDKIAEIIAEADRIVHATAAGVAKIGEFLHRSSLNLASTLADRRALAAGNRALVANYRVSRATDRLTKAQLLRDEADRDAERTHIAVRAEKAELGL